MSVLRGVFLIGFISLLGASASAKKLTPSLRHFPAVSGSDCDDKKPIKDENGHPLADLCPDELKTCIAEKICFFNNGEDRMLLSYLKEDRFRVIDRGPCPFGYGAKDVCLDPYYGVSADGAFYKPGDVIYIDAARGVKLPDGSYHTGYFIVRDTDPALKGENRFEFFVGASEVLDEDNPFVKLGFANPNSKIEFSRITDSQKINTTLKGREYPNAVVGTFVFPGDLKKDTTPAPASGPGTSGSH